MSLIKRKRLFVDASVQGALFIRIVVYWFSGLFAIGGLLLYWHAISHPDRRLFDQFSFRMLFEEYAPVIIASLLILLVVLYDTLVLSNRFAGPICRLRRSMRALAAGEPVEPLRFRKGDFWQEIAQEFDAIVQQQEQLKKRPASDAAAQKATSKDRCEREGVAAR